MSATHPRDFGFWILDFGFAAHPASPCGLRRDKPARQERRMPHKGQMFPGCLVVRPSRPHMQAGRLRYKDDRNAIRLPPRTSSRETWSYSLRGMLPAPSTNHNQRRMPFSTPTSRKVAAGPARRGFPRAGGRGVGAGKWSSRASARPNAARRRAKGAQRARSVAPTKARFRRRHRPSPRGRGRRPRTAGGGG